MLDATLKSKIRKLWDRFWSGGLTNPFYAIEQMSYLIFMKKLEDEDSKRQQEANFTGQKYKSIFEGHTLIGRKLLKLEYLFNLTVSYLTNL